MTNHNDRRAFDGYRLVDKNMLSFLWFQTAGITLHYFGIGKIQPATDVERLDCVLRLGKLWREHSDIFSDDAVLVMNFLIAAAKDLAAVHGH